MSAADIGFVWWPDEVGWVREGLPVQFSGGVRFLLTSVLGKVFVVVHGWIFLAPCSSLTLTMFGREMRLCSEVSLLVVSGMVCHLGK